MSSNARTLQNVSIFRISRSIVSKLGGPSVLLLLIWPWVLLVINRSWIFLNGTFVDSWIYYGFFNNLPEHLNIYASSTSQQGFYYDDRLSWILPGYLVYQLFPPLLANYILHLGLYYVVVFALYAILAYTIHRRVALLATLLMGSYPYFLIAVGWDYVDGSGLAYFSIMVLLLTLAEQRSGRPIWLGLAGATGAALIISNIFWVALIPSIGVYYFFIHRHYPFKLIMIGLAPLMIGALILTIVIGWVNLTFGGSFLFFASSFEFASSSSKMASNPWISVPDDWPISNPYLVWPTVMLLACGLWLVSPRLRARFVVYPQSMAFLVLFLLLALTMLAIHLRGSTPVLQAFFYASYLIPALFLAIGSFFTPLIVRLSRAQFVGLVGATLLTSLVSFSFRSCGEFPITYPVLVGMVLGFAWLILLICLPNHVWSYGVFLVAFCIATPSAFQDFSNHYVTNSFCALAPQTQPQPEDQYLTVLDGIETIRQVAPEKRVYFWFNEREQPIYSSLSSAYLYTWNQVSRNFPAFGGPDTSFPGFAPPPGLTVVVLSRSPSALADAQTTLGRRSRTLRLLGQHEIRRGEIQFNLLVGVIEAIPEHVALDTMIDFRRPGETDRFLLRGWWGPDTTGTWTVGPKAELHMLLDHAPDQDIDLTVDVANSIGAFVSNPPDMLVHVSVNGVQLDTWQFNAEIKGGQFSIVLPKNVLAISDTTRIAFDIVNPHSPRELGFNYNDIRAMGIEVRSIRFTQHNFWNAQSDLLGTPPPTGLRVGRSDADGWAANTEQDAEGFLQYGPYTRTISPGDHTAVWRLMIDNNTADDLPIVRLEVVDATANSRVLASRIVTRREWKSQNEYEDLTVPFSLAAASPPHALELRIWWYDHAYVREQHVRIQ
jgi:hypothetical protein